VIKDDYRLKILIFHLHRLVLVSGKSAEGGCLLGLLHSNLTIESCLSEVTVKKTAGKFSLDD